MHEDDHQHAYTQHIEGRRISMVPKGYRKLLCSEAKAGGAGRLTYAPKHARGGPHEEPRRDKEQLSAERGPEQQPKTAPGRPGSSCNQPRQLLLPGDPGGRWGGLGQLPWEATN